MAIYGAETRDQTIILKTTAEIKTAARTGAARERRSMTAYIEQLILNDRDACKNEIK